MISQTTKTNPPARPYWPDGDRLLLLRAALLQDDAALTAWDAWKALANLDDVEHGSWRLLPLLYRNLSALGVRDPLLAKVKGVYRYTWYKNQLHFNRLVPLLQALQAAGLQTMVLKGAALAVLHYRDHGLRPMSDFDIFVPTEQVYEAIRVLTQMGWHTKDKFPDRLVKVRHSAGYQDAAHQELDLHWHALLECCYPHADDDFWTGAVPLQIAGVSTWALNPADQLLHVCAHGAYWDVASIYSWIPDSIMIMRSAGQALNWERLLEQTRRLRLVPQMQDCLTYLQHTFAAPVPTAVLESLRQIPTTRVQQLEYEFNISPDRALGGLPKLIFQYMRMTEGTSLPRKLFGFPEFLQHTWAIDHLWEVPVQSLSKGIRRFGIYTGMRKARQETRSFSIR